LLQSFFHGACIASGSMPHVQQKRVTEKGGFGLGGLSKSVILSSTRARKRTKITRSVKEGFEPSVLPSAFLLMNSPRK
jgi:hypothetical protein